MMYRVVFVHMVLNATRAIRNARTSRASRRSYESAWQQYNFILLAFSLFTECLTSLPLSPFSFRIVLHEPRRGFSLAVSYSLFSAYPLCIT